MKIDIQEIINTKIKDMEEKKVVEKCIEETIEKTVIKAVTSAIDGYTIERLIKDKVEKEVSEVVSAIGFTAYNGFIAEKIKKIVEDTCNADISEKIEKTFNEILINKRENVKLSEICEKYRNYICEAADEDEKYSLEHFYVNIEAKEYPYNWLTFTFAKEKPSSYHSYGNEEVEFTVHRDRDGENKGTISTVYLDGKSINDTFKFGGMSEIELLLVNLSYNKTPIIIDVESEDDIDNYFDIDN